MIKIIKHFLTIQILFFLITTQSFAYYNDLSACFQESGRKYGIDPNVLYTIAQAETKFNPYFRKVENEKNNYIGIMSLHSSWIPLIQQKNKELKKHPEYLYNPCINIDASAYVLSICFRKYGNTPKGLNCYFQR
ncbi:hypothetical protein JCM14244_17200 [Venenivibrio stagnispumantis]|uniref:Transglycosylase SLT domain-containing protein n=1 Tax=Venenivibrio stagnispumantis TaxID=407998 RepID=A0AA45WPV6_9AQUI|nr:lytic transglycosylase domain-containing protein [Venenivibrio stagnispumantis]MCW4573959.1 lytic transglycosylase domain-containing protein [Venenivibrio stagnispumantis]SMP22706.1 Transglycosylase SLT domain-containing protein [Venenivibrio stagnispumantis]